MIYNKEQYAKASEELKDAPFHFIGYEKGFKPYHIIADTEERFLSEVARFICMSMNSKIICDKNDTTLFDIDKCAINNIYDKTMGGFNKYELRMKIDERRISGIDIPKKDPEPECDYEAW